MKTILTVDDSASIRDIVSLVLRAGGYEVFEAVDGVDALSKLEGRQVDLILTDVNMPEMDGLELVRRLRAMPQYKFVPIVVLTGCESPTGNRQEAKAAGATAWIAKPFHPDQLLGVMKKVMRG
jgi:two-component system chemotaxis response regulator CheY